MSGSRVSMEGARYASSAEDLVQRIHALNDGWHALRDLWPPEAATDPVLQGLRNLKAMLQVQLLRGYPALAHLEVDSDPGLPEPCFSVRLHGELAPYRDARHLPVRVAEDYLTAREIAQLLGRSA